MRWILVTAAALSLQSGMVPPRVLATVTSPDGRTVIEIRRWYQARERVDGPIVYHVSRDGKDVIADSPLGLRRADQDFDAASLTFVGEIGRASCRERV